MEVIIRLKPEEYEAYMKYAKTKGLTLEELVKDTLDEILEDELDRKIIQEYEEDLKNGDIKTYSHEEVKKYLDIYN